MALDNISLNGPASMRRLEADPITIERTNSDRTDNAFSNILDNLLRIQTSGSMESAKLNQSGLNTEPMSNSVNDINVTTAKWLVAAMMQNLSVPGMESDSSQGNDGIYPATSGTNDALNPYLSLLTTLAATMAQNGMTPSMADFSPSTHTSSSIPGSSVQDASSPSETETTNSTIRAAIQNASDKYGVPASLIRGVIEQESGMNPQAVSSAGAIGLMQLMPITAKALGVDNPLDPVQNIDAGSKYLKQLLSRFNGDTSLALAAYNAGPGAVVSHGGIPPYSETQNYVVRVLSLTNQYQNNGW